MPAVFLLLAALARAEITPPVGDKPAAAEPAPTVQERWSDLAEAIEEAKKPTKQVGVVVIYDLHTDAKLPPFIFITRRQLYKTVVIGFLDALYGDRWKATGKYWVVDQGEAVERIAKAMKAKDADAVKAIRSKIKDELGPGMFMIYRVDHELGEEPPDTPN